MIRRPSTRRTAATLLEVLIGFGILGVAAISIMTLFPFAALTMSTATKDDRATTAAIAGDALVRDWHRRNVVEPTDSKSVEPYHRLMDDPTGKSLATQPPVPSYAASFGTGVARTPLPANSTESSYPVYLDPMGVVAGRGDVGAGLIPRTSAQAVLEQPAAGWQRLSLRYCSLMDGLKFDEGGDVPQNFDMRELRYNFAWMLQRPSNRDRYTVRTQVVVYDRRAHLYNPPGSEAAFGTTLFPGTTQIDGVPSSLEVRKGTWVLDAGNATLRQAEFYRVMSVTDNNNGTYTLDVHKPIVWSGNPAATGGASPPFNSTIVVIPAIADVFERPMLSAGTGP